MRYATALLISYMVFNPFKMVVQFFWTTSSFQNFDGPNAFFKVQQVHGPAFEKVAKSLSMSFTV